MTVQNKMYIKNFAENWFPVLNVQQRTHEKQLLRQFLICDFTLYIFIVTISSCGHFRIKYLLK